MFLAGLYALGILSNSVTKSGQIARSPLLPSFDKMQATGIVLDKPSGESINIQKRDGKCVVVVGGLYLPASAIKVQALLDSVAGLEYGKLVNSDTALEDRFSLDPQHAKHLTITNASGEKLISFLVGKPGASGYEDYIRLSDDKRVYLTRSSMNFYFSQTADYWYDLMLLPDDVTGNSIRSIAVTGAIPEDPQGKRIVREDYTLTKSGTADSQWVIVGKSLSLDQARVQTFVNRLAMLQGVDFSTVSRPASADLTISITTDKGQHFTLAGTAIKGGAQYQFYRDEFPYAYIVNSLALMRAVAPIEILASQKQ